VLGMTVGHSEAEPLSMPSELSPFVPK